MANAAIVVLAGTETKADLGRVVNGLQVARELKDAGDEATIVFDGAGTQWVPKLTDTDSDYHSLYAQVEDLVQGACEYCADAFGVADKIERTAVGLLDEFDGHPSLRKLMDNGYQVLTF